MLIPTSLFGIGAGSDAQTNPSPGGVPASSNPAAPAYQWMAGWLVFILLLALAMKTRIGHAVIYYALVLLLVFLLVTQYQFIASALAPIGTKAPS